MEQGEGVVFAEQPAPAAVDVPPGLEPSERQTKSYRRKLNKAIVKFVAGWVGFVLILLVVGLMANLEWARPKVEQAMMDSFHRNVRLGSLSWTLGLNGLSIWTNRLVMTESDGKPFIIAGNSEIGVAFLPLLDKRVIVKHVQFHHPEVFATQLAPGKWNFTDLLVEGPEIRYVEVDDGILHLRNEMTAQQLQNSKFRGVFSNLNWTAYDFQNVGVKLIFPRKHQRRPWPFYLTFKLPRENEHGKYVTDVSLTCLLNGQFDKWRENKCEIELRADQVNPDDWRPFLQIPPNSDALFGIKFKGKGILRESIAGEFTGTAHDITITNAGQTIFSAPQANWTSQLTITGQRFEWDKLNLEVAGVNMQSKGVVAGWQNENPSYSATVAADLESLSQLSDTSFWKLLPGLGQKQEAPKLSGAALVELKLEGDRNKQNISTSLKADGIPLAHLLNGGTKGNAPFLSLFQVEPNAPIKGQIVIDKDQSIVLKDVEIPAKGANLKIHGTINANKHQHDVELSAKDLPLDDLDGADLAAGGSSNVALTGKVDFGAHFTSDGKTNNVDVKAKLKNATVSSGKAVLADKLSGDVGFDGTSLILSHVSGSIANKDGTTGSIILNGAIGTDKNGKCALSLDGKHVDIGQLVAFSRSAGMALPDYIVDPITGTARDINLQIKGKSDAPQVALALTPENVDYQLAPPKGMSLKPLNITGGSIVLTGDRLELKELPITAQSGKLTLSAMFAGSGDNLTPKSVHLKSAGIDVAELQQYLSSPAIAQQTQKAIAALVSPLKVSSAQGKTSGDIKISMGPKADSPCTFDGTVAFTNVSGKFLAQQVPFANLSGTVAVSTNELTLQDIAATTGNSRFGLQGSVKNYQQSPVWSLQMTSQFKADDLLRVMPTSMSQGVTASSDGLMDMKASVVGDAQSNRVVLYAHALPDGNVRVKGGFGSFAQPAQQPLTVDCSVQMRCSNNGQTEVKVDSCRILAGDSPIQGSGRYSWNEDATKQPNMEFIVTTPNAVPAATLISALMPDLDLKGASGSIKGTFAFAGTPTQLLTHGDFNLSKVTVPAWKLKDVDGRLHSPRWTLGAGSPDGNGGTSQIQIDIANATVAGVPAKGVSGTILMENGAEPKISLNDGVANVAGGKVLLTASCLPNSQKWHFQMGMQQLQVDEFVTDLIEHSGEVTGLADGEVVIDSQGATLGDLLANMDGHGQIAVKKGSVPKVAQLQEKLTQANLLQQGIFGFNLNNVLSTVLPGKAGKFKEVSMSFNINDGVASFERLTFDGTDLRLRAVGNWNIPQNNLSVDVAGNIPRVASSILPGAVGEVSRNFTLQKAVSVMTFRKLGNLPNVPILGDIATDEPRAFTFKIACNLDSPNAVQQSISKTFKWLPNKPNASAHPIPGLAM